MRLYQPKTILFIGHDYHRITRSSAFFKNLLWSIGSVDELFYDPDGNSEPLDYRQIVESGNYSLVIVWQLEDAAAQLVGLDNVIFVPMYDGCKDLPHTYWVGLKGMRVLAFSIPVYVQAQLAGCEAQYCQYWPDVPADLREIEKERGRGFYWYRRNDLSLHRLDSICEAAGVQVLDLLWKPDPLVTEIISQSRFRDGLSARVNFVPWQAGRYAQLKNIARSSVYIASRRFEGIGMAFLEAMSLGCCVVAPRNPTYTDYIVSRQNGFLIDEDLNYPIQPVQADVFNVGVRAAQAAEDGRSRWLANGSQVRDWLMGAESFSFFGCHFQNKPKQQSTARVPNISVVTVVKNSPDHLRTTIENVINQKGIVFEYLIYDGASTDDTLKVAMMYEGKVSRIVSMRDNGTYDAMNRSLDLVTGDFVLFMNAGDRFVSEDSLCAFFANVGDDVDFVVGHTIYCRSNGVEELHRVADFRDTYQSLKEGRLNNVWQRGIPSHQATATRVDLLRRLKYDTEFDIAADHDLMFKAASLGARFEVRNLYVSIYEGGGESERKHLRCVQQWLKIGLKYSRLERDVWDFYAPRLLPHILASWHNTSTVKDALGFVWKERWTLLGLAKHTSFKHVIKPVKRFAKPIKRFAKPRLKVVRRRAIAFKGNSRAR